MLLQALRVEIKMKNLNLQVMFLVQNGVGTPLPRVPTSLHPWLRVTCIYWSVLQIRHSTFSKRHPSLSK